MGRVRVSEPLLAPAAPIAAVDTQGGSLLARGLIAFGTGFIPDYDTESLVDEEI